MPFVAPLDLARDAVLMTWQGTVVDSSEERDAADFLKDALCLNTAPRVLGCVETLPSLDENGRPVKGTGGRVDLVFAIAADDVASAATHRLKTSDLKWMFDYKDIYDKEILKSLKSL